MATRTEDLQTLGFYIDALDDRVSFGEVIEDIRESLKIIRRLFKTLIPAED